MRACTLVLVILAGCINKKKTCDECATEDHRQACEDTVESCNLLGPFALPLRQSCLESARLSCDADDTDSGTMGE